MRKSYPNQNLRAKNEEKIISEVEDKLKSLGKDLNKEKKKTLASLDYKI